MRTPETKAHERIRARRSHIVWPGDRVRTVPGGPCQAVVGTGQNRTERTARLNSTTGRRTR